MTGRSRLGGTDRFALFAALLCLLLAGAVAAAPARPIHTTGREIGAALRFARLGALAQSQPLAVTATLQSAATADGNGAAMGVRGLGTIGVQITGTMGTATVTFQGTIDGTNWNNLLATNLTSGTSAATTTSLGNYSVVGAVSQFRAAISGAGGGTSLTVIALASASGGGGGAGGGGGGGGAVTVANGADVAQGNTTDAAVGNATGTLNAHLRYADQAIGDVWDSVNHLFNVGLATTLDKSVDSIASWTPAGGMAAGAFVSGAVLSGAYADGSLVTVGTLADAAVGDASGTLNAHARQIAKLLGSGVAVTAASGSFASGALASGSVASGALAAGSIASGAAVSGAFADGAITTLGLNADAAVGDATGTANAHLRQIAKTLAGTVNTAPQAAATGGATGDSYICTGAANQDSRSIDASACTIYFIHAFNTNASVRWLKVYNKASAATSADTPVLRFAIPGQSAGGANGFTAPLGPAGIALGTGLSVRVSTGQADNDATAVTSGDVVYSLGYK